MAVPVGPGDRAMTRDVVIAEFGRRFSPATTSSNATPPSRRKSASTATARRGSST
jgi:hypothetical protein